MPISRSAARVAGSIAGRKAVSGGSSGNPLLFDGFDYEVGKTEENTTAEPKFIAAGWAGCKRLPTNTGAYGYLYTVTQAEMEATTGYTGPLPGSGSRCLKMEVDEDTPQTDFWLQLYTGAEDLIPADVWFQFWLYSPNYGSETANLTGRQKFLYPSNNDYPSSSDKWLFVTTADSYAPYNAQPYGSKTSGEVTAVLRDFNGSTVWYSPAADNNDKLGPNLVSAANGYCSGNEWTLWKIHFDTSTTSGKFELWMRPYGGEWRKTHEWIDGVTADLTFTVTDPGGHRWLRMPSTFPGNAIPNVYGAQYYMDDFAMAASESDLPTYAD